MLTQKLEIRIAFVFDVSPVVRIGVFAPFDFLFPSILFLAIVACERLLVLFRSVFSFCCMSVS